MPAHDYGAIYEDIWHRFLSHQRAFSEAMQALRSTEHARTGLDTALLTFDRVECATLEDKARSIVHVLVRLAETEFAPGAMRVEIDHETMQAVWETAGTHRHHREGEFDPDSFSPAAVWQVLEQAYSGSAGTDAALTQAADALVDRFRLTPDTEVKRVKGRPCLSVSVFLENFGLGDHLGLRTSQEIVAIFNRLGEVAEHLGYPAHPMRVAAQDWFGPHCTVTSRARYRYGLLELVTYKSRFEFQFEPEFGAELQAFLGDYATRFREAA